MKKIVIFALIILLLLSCKKTKTDNSISENLNEQINLETDNSYEKCYVNSLYGLNMRTEPNGEIITTLEYNSEVLLLTNRLEENKAEINGISGYWVNIKSSNFEGWVFDTYLSNSPIETINLEFDLSVYNESYLYPKDMDANACFQVEEKWEELIKQKSDQELSEIIQGFRTTYKNDFSKLLNFISLKVIEYEKNITFEYLQENNYIDLIENQKYIIYWSIIHENVAIVEFLDEKGIKFDKYVGIGSVDYPIFYAIETMNIPIIKIVLQTADITVKDTFFKGYYPFEEAMKKELPNSLIEEMIPETIDLVLEDKIAEKKYWTYPSFEHYSQDSGNDIINPNDSYKILYYNKEYPELARVLFYGGLSNSLNIGWIVFEQ